MGNWSISRPRTNANGFSAEIVSGDAGHGIFAQAAHRGRIEELICDANANGTNSGASVTMLQEQLAASQSSANACQDRAERAETELERLRAAQPAPEPADIQMLRSQLAVAEAKTLRATIRAEDAEHQARCWAAGKGDPEKVASYEVRSLACSLDATLVREHEALVMLRASEAALEDCRRDVQRLDRTLRQWVNAGKERDEMAKKLANAKELVNEQRSAVTRLEERARKGFMRAAIMATLHQDAEARIERMNARIAELEAAAPQADPGEPLRLIRQLVTEGEFNGLTYTHVVNLNGDSFLPSSHRVTEAANNLAELVRCYNVLHSDETSPEDAAFDRVIKLAAERHNAKVSRRAADLICEALTSVGPSVPGPTTRDTMAAIICLEISRSVAEPSPEKAPGGLCSCARRCRTSDATFPYARIIFPYGYDGWALNRDCPNCHGTGRDSTAVDKSRDLPDFSSAQVASATAEANLRATSGVIPSFGVGFLECWRWLGGKEEA